MFSLIMLAAAVASFALTYAARRIRGYYDVYYVTPDNRADGSGIVIPLRPVRVISFIMGAAFAYASLMGWYFASMEAISY
jgi:hypothetical protein